MSAQSSLILASGSVARRALLAGAGLEFRIAKSAIDERGIEAAFTGEPEELAFKLAAEKAKTVSIQNKESLVIGADQILVCNGKIHSKAKDIAEATAKIKELQGKTHRLISAAVLARNGDIIWREADHANLDMRPLSDDDIRAYIGQADESILTGCVGCYALEGLGSWFFERIEGNYFTILGLPLLPLLRELERHGYGPLCT